jgi:hypothetical protein
MAADIVSRSVMTTSFFSIKESEMDEKLVRNGIGSGTELPGVDKMKEMLHLVSFWGRLFREPYKHRRGTVYFVQNNLNRYRNDAIPYLVLRIPVSLCAHPGLEIDSRHIETCSRTG